MTQHYNVRRVRGGFTIIELMIVIAIGGGILAFGAMMIQRLMSAANMSRTEQTLQRIQTDIQRFQIATGKWPTKLTELMTRPADPKIAPKWRGPYIDEEPDDGWGNPIRYELTPGKPKPYRLYSFGPNGPGSPEEEWIYAT